MGQFLRSSYDNASIVSLIHNICMNAVSAEFHCVYDNIFYSVSIDYTTANIPVTTDFHNLFRFLRDNHYNPEDIRQQREHQLVDIDFQK